jgi:hypothetical protein
MASFILLSHLLSGVKVCKDRLPFESERSSDLTLGKNWRNRRDNDV